MREATPDTRASSTFCGLRSSARPPWAALHRGCSIRWRTHIQRSGVPVVGRIIRRHSYENYDYRSLLGLRFTFHVVGSEEVRVHTSNARAIYMSIYYKFTERRPGGGAWYTRVQRCDSIWYSSTDMRGKKAKSRPNGAKLGSTRLHAS